MTPPQKSRREALESFVAVHPADAFARYGLAIECARLSDNDAARDHFRQLLADHPGYVTGYFQFGQFLARLDEPNAARDILTQGIAAAVESGDTHARDEMQAALDSLL
jgi:Tfp pilus assembly protein PilF